MSELQAYYDAFVDDLRRGPRGLTAEECRCRGGGWLLSDVDTIHKCPDHYVPGQRHPDDDWDDDDQGANIWDLEFPPFKPGVDGALPGDKLPLVPLVTDDDLPF